MKIILIITLLLLIISLHAYTRLHRTMLWYRHEYEKYPRYYKPAPTKSWSQKMMDIVIIMRGMFSGS